jgi:hypothetical protein
MANEKNKIILPEGVKEIIIREGQAPATLPELAPVKTDISGTIGAVVEFLRLRIYTDQKDRFQIDPMRSHVIVDRENLSISLIISENDPYLKGCVKGTMKVHPKFAEFGINSGKSWEPNALGQFFKMNRFYFPDKAKNMELVSQLKSFIANVNSKVEKEKKENGNFADNYSSTVSSNIPSAFTLQIPLFKGTPTETIEVEFYASVDGRDVSLQLFSPSANQLVEEMRDKVIDEQIEAIKSILHIVIIEK